MKIRVVGGPIRRDDRLVVEVTSHTTFETILSIVHQKVEELDLLDLAREHFTLGKSPTTAPERGEGQKQHHATEFGAQVAEEDGGDSSGSSSDDEEDPPTQNAKKKPPPSATRDGNQDVVGAGLPKQPEPDTAAPSGCRDPVAPCCVRLTLHPVDAAHYDVALIEFEPNGKPKATRTCRPSDTPRTVQMKVPVVGLFLKKALRTTSPENHTLVPNRSLVSPQGVQELMAFADRSHTTPLMETESPPQQLLRKESCREGSTHHEDISGMSRPQSFSMARYSHTSADQGPLDRLLLLYRIAKSDVGRVSQMERLVARVGRRKEAFLDVAEAALSVDHTGGGGCIDGALGVSFRLQHTKDFLTSAICTLDGDASNRDTASIMADMVVHAAPPGEETLYAAAFLHGYLTDAHMRRRPIATMVRSAQQRLPKECGASPASIERLELAHREVVCRLELQCAYPILLRGRVAALDATPQRRRAPHVLTTSSGDVDALDMSFDDGVTPSDHLNQALAAVSDSSSDEGHASMGVPRCGGRIRLEDRHATALDDGTSESSSFPPTPNLQLASRRPTLQPSSYAAHRHVDPSLPGPGLRADDAAPHVLGANAVGVQDAAGSPLLEVATRVAVLEEEVRCMRLTLEEQTATMAKFLAQRI